MLRISFYLNHDFVTADVPAQLSALEYLRGERGLTGTKEVCNEGDCGACTIALGQPVNGRVIYQAVNSCLLPAAKLHGCHVVTVEGLAEGDRLHPVQQAMVDHHAVQCGYCTPGMVMSLFCLFLDHRQPDAQAIAEALDGTLCRCTGYAAISRAAMAMAERIAAGAWTDAELRPAYFAPIAPLLESLSPAQSAGYGGAGYGMPRSLPELFDVMAARGDASYALINGSTDVTLDVRFKQRRAARYFDLSRIAELATVSAGADGVTIGANVTLTAILKNAAIGRAYPALAQAISQMCSRQIRNVATLVGNVCCASPIGDSIPPLLVYDAVAVLRSAAGERRLPLAEFFTGYRTTALEKNEIVAALQLPPPSGWSRFEKTGKRRALDIASVNSAMRIVLEGDMIREARLAFGGVAAVPVLAHTACDVLRGQRLSADVIAAAATAAEQEITPISDVRGSADFRRLLARNHVIKHLSSLAASHS
jgi:xanthine dehydrogenase small subunit